VLDSERSQGYSSEVLNEATNAVGKFLRIQFTHQNNERRLPNQNYSKRKHKELMWKPEVRKTTKREENSSIIIVITCGLL